MKIALIHKDSLLLGPMGFNVRMINSELRDLELSDFITSQSYLDLPIHFSDGITHLVPIEEIIPQYDSRYQNTRNFIWEISKENEVPVKVFFTYLIENRTLDEVKHNRKQEVPGIRKRKENTIITLKINGVDIKVSTSKEERISLSTKLSSSSGPYNFKFLNTWLDINTEQLQYILNEIDKVVQSAFDWELSKILEIDSCNSIDEVYSVEIYENDDNLDEISQNLFD
jgi:hypothetical protein